MREKDQLADAAPSRKIGAFASATSVLLCSVGTDGRLKFLNSAWERALGYDHEELWTLSLYELLASRPAGFLQRLLDAAYPDPMEFGLRCKDGTHKRFLWHRRYDPQTRRMFIAGEEISEPSSAK